MSTLESHLHDEHMAFNATNGAQRSDAIAAAVRRQVPDAVGLTLLDLGCGPGHIGVRLAADFGQVILADPDAEALALASQASEGMANTRVVRCDLTQSIPAGLAADVVVSSLSWHHIEDLDALMDALPRVSPGGRLFVIDMDEDGGAYHADRPEYAHITGFDRDQLLRQVEAHGYTHVTIADLWQGEKWVGEKLVPMSLFLLRARVPEA